MVDSSSPDSEAVRGGEGSENMQSSNCLSAHSTFLDTNRTVESRGAGEAGREVKMRLRFWKSELDSIWNSSSKSR